MPRLGPGQWGRLGAGAALALVGSGLLSFGTLIRLAAIAGAAAIAYRAWSPPDGAPEAELDAPIDEPGSSLPTASSLPSAMPLRQTGLGTASDFPAEPGGDLATGAALESDRGE